MTFFVYVGNLGDNQIDALRYFIDGLPENHRVVGLAERPYGEAQERLNSLFSNIFLLDWNASFFSHLDLSTGSVTKADLKAFEDKHLTLVDDFRKYFHGDISQSCSELNICVCIQGDLTPFQGVGLVGVYCLTQAIGLNFYWVTKSPFKGRAIICNDPFMRSEPLNKATLDKISSKNDRSVPFVLTDYLNFKRSHDRLFDRLNREFAKSCRGRKLALLVINQICSWLCSLWVGRSVLAGAGEKTVVVLPKKDHWLLSSISQTVDWWKVIFTEGKEVSIGTTFCKFHPRDYQFLRSLKLARAFNMKLLTCQSSDVLTADINRVVTGGSSFGVELYLSGVKLFEVGVSVTGLNWFRPGGRNGLVGYRGIEDLNTDRVRTAYAQSLIEHSFRYSAESSGLHSLDRPPERFEEMARWFVEKVTGDSRVTK